MVREVHRQIERDADAWAIGRTHDRAALASAICKSALSRSTTPALTMLTGAGTADRVEELLSGPPTPHNFCDRIQRATALFGAGALIAMTVAWLSMLVGSGLSHDAVVALQHACSSGHT
jgi:hypothetical protein